MKHGERMADIRLNACEPGVTVRTLDTYWILRYYAESLDICGFNGLEKIFALGGILSFSGLHPGL